MAIGLCIFFVIFCGACVHSFPAAQLDLQEEYDMLEICPSKKARVQLRSARNIRGEKVEIAQEEGNEQYFDVVTCVNTSQSCLAVNPETVKSGCFPSFGHSIALARIVGSEADFAVDRITLPVGCRCVLKISKDKNEVPTANDGVWSEAVELF